MSFHGIEAFWYEIQIQYRLLVFLLYPIGLSLDALYQPRNWWHVSSRMRFRPKLPEWWSTLCSLLFFLRFFSYSSRSTALTLRVVDRCCGRLLQHHFWLLQHRFRLLRHRALLLISPSSYVAANLSFVVRRCRLLPCRASLPIALASCICLIFFFPLFFLSSPRWVVADHRRDFSSSFFSLAFAMLCRRRR